MREFPINEQPQPDAGKPDSELLRGWSVHQTEADFTELVRRHLRLVQGIASRELDAAVAEDIAQQVFAILARKAPSLAGLHSLSGWLYQVTMLQCRNVRRSQMRDRRKREAAMEYAQIPEARDPLADALPHLNAALGELPASDRELILLRYSEGLSFRDAAQRTGRKEAALRQQTSRAIEKLSNLLLRRGVSVPVSVLVTGLGVQLAGTSTASAASVVSKAALANAGGLSWAAVTGVTFLTMTTKQSLILGAAILALGITTITVVATHRTPGSPGPGATVRAAAPGAETSKADSPETGADSRASGKRAAGAFPDLDARYGASRVALSKQITGNLTDFMDALLSKAPDGRTLFETMSDKPPEKLAAQHPEITLDEGQRARFAELYSGYEKKDFQKAVDGLTALREKPAAMIAGLLASDALARGAMTPEEYRQAKADVPPKLAEFIDDDSGEDDEAPFDDAAFVSAFLAILTPEQAQKFTAANDAKTAAANPVEPAKGRKLEQIDVEIGASLKIIQAMQAMMQQEH